MFLRFKVCCGFFLWGLQVSMAHAFQVSPSETEVHLGGGKDQLHKIQVVNSGKVTSYMKVSEVVRVINPGTVNQKEVKVDNATKNEIMVSPSLLVIPPKSDIDITIIDLVDNRVVEEAYYVTLMPVLKEGNGINISVSYRVLVRALPESIIEDVVVLQNENNFIVKNNGNSRIALEDIKLCQIRFRGADDCIFEKKRHVRVYPGIEYNIPKNGKSYLSFEMEFPKQRSYKVLAD